MRVCALNLTAIPQSLDHSVSLNEVFVQDLVVTLLNIGINNINMVLGAFQFQLVAVIF
jgi:hypothetical protein